MARSQHATTSLGVLLALVAGLLSAGPAARTEGSVVFKILAVNPSETETKEVVLRGILPPEVTPASVIDPDGLEVEYDSRLGTYFVTGTVTLRPKQSVTRNVLIDDVWVIPETAFAQVEQEIAAILEKLEGTAFAERGQLMAGAMTRRLRELRLHRELPVANPEAHISRYREDLKALQLVESEMVSLRQLMVMAAIGPARASGLPADMAGGGAGAHAGGGLSVLATWRLIFMMLSLLGAVSLSFFLVWQRQLKLQLAKQAALLEEDAPVAEAVLTNGGAAVASRAASAPPAVTKRVHPKSPLSS